jgi:hypothetical protein
MEDGKMGLIEFIIEAIAGIFGLVIGILGGIFGLVVGLFGAVFGLLVAAIVLALVAAPVLLLMVLIF